MSTPNTTPKSKEIRALYDNDTITVYQAYNSTIADAAVSEQRLNASELWIPARMTWIKPSWAWMLYRSGYSYKDENQSNILALRVEREYFHDLLRAAVLSGDPATKRGAGQVRVQWDPERTIKLGRLNSDGSIRSIQIGIPREAVLDWIPHIVSIEDVTQKARELKRVLDAEDVTVAECIERGIVPVERVYELPADIAQVVGISADADELERSSQ